MRTNKPKAKGDKLQEILSRAKKDQGKRSAMYRDRALKLFPHICGRCGREFQGKRLQELTVHHKDHDHENNPPDGSNWELLCVYCHEMEHRLDLEQEEYGYDSGHMEEGSESSSGYKPFANLKDLLNNKE
jgi:hypothetical protein